MRIKKLAGGGLPPFVGFTGVQLPLPAYAGIGSNSSSSDASSSSTSSKSSGSSGDIGLLNKEMQKLIMENGLPSDVKYLLSKIDIFGNGIDPHDPHSQERAYASLLAMLPEIKLNKAEYDDAIKHAREKGTLDQYAVSNDGKAFVVNGKGKITLKDPAKAVKDGDVRLTNGELAQLRAYQLPMDLGNLTNVIASSISVSDITKNVNDILDKVGKITRESEQYIRKDSKTLLLVDGYHKLIEQGEDGVYKISEKTIKQDLNVKALLQYISTTLTLKEKGVLKNIAADYGLSGEEGIQAMLGLLIQGRLEDSHSIKVDYDSSATKGTKGNGESDGDDSKKMLSLTPLMDYFLGNNGYETEININPGKTHQLVVSAINYNLPSTAKGDGLVSMTSFDKFLTETGIGAIANASNGVYVGDQFVDSAHFNRLIYSGGDLLRAYLPVTTDKNGQTKPNLDIIDQFEEAKKHLSGNISAANAQLYLEAHGLSLYFIFKDGKLEINPQTVMPFFIVNVYGDGDSHFFTSGHDGIFDPDNLDYLSKVDNFGINEDELEARIKLILGKEAKYKAEGSLYSGMAFIPIRGTDLRAAQASGQHPKSYVPNTVLDQMSRDKSNLFNQTPKSVLSNG